MFTHCNKYSIGSNRLSKIYISENLKFLKWFISNQEKVDLIYIDAPYNTGNETFFGQDKISWSQMIEQRISLAHKALNNDGFILFSIDENEYDTVKGILNSEFGRQNFVANFVWQRRNYKDTFEHSISVEHEYVLCYSASNKSVPRYPVSTWIENTKNVDLLPSSNRKSIYASFDQDVRNNINNLFGDVVVNNHPKPVSLLMGLYDCFLKENGTVLDLFGGSGTTGEAIIRLNYLKKTNYKFIITQISKPKPNRRIKNIANLTVQRNRLLFQRLNQEFPSLGGFDVFINNDYKDKHILYDWKRKCD